MKLTAPRLARFRSSFSNDDGRFAQLVLVNKTGANFAFTISFADVGKLLTSICSIARQMGERLTRSGEASHSSLSRACRKPRPSSGWRVGTDAESGEALIWLETEQDGGHSFRLSEEMLQELRDATASPDP